MHSSLILGRTIAFLNLGQVIHFFEEMKISIEGVIGDVYSLACPNENCVYLSTNKNSNFHFCKKCRACSHALEFPSFKEQKPTFSCLEVMVHIALQQNESWLRKKTSSIFEEVYPPITIKHTRTWARKSKNHSIYGIIVSILHWLIQITKKSFPFAFCTLSVYCKATWFSLSLTAVMSGVSTLDHIQLHWL